MYRNADGGSKLMSGRLLGWAISCVLLFLVIGPLIERCSQMPGSENLQFGQRVMHQMMGRENLRQVGFFETYPKARPSDFVNLVSDPNHVLWPPPPPETPTNHPSSGNRIWMPPDVAFSAYDRRASEGDEIVYVPDDDNRKMIIRGFSPGEPEPTFEYVWDFPTKAGRVTLR